MKYVLMFVDTEQFAADLAAMDDAERERAYGRVREWFTDHADKITNHTYLLPPDTATTVRMEGGEPLITDGPFVEGKEVISGFAEIDVADMDEALRMVKAWPACPLVEIRPVAATLTSASSDAELTRVVRQHAGQLAASLVNLIGDFSAAEDLVQDAIEAALRHWPTEGIPDRPGGWLYAVARRRGLDVLRRESRYREKLARVPWPTQPEPDDRLRLIFTCCHPALPRTAQIALTLRVVCGLSTGQIAKAFLHSGIHRRAAHHPSQTQDQRCRHPVPDPRRRRIARPAGPSPRRGLPTVQRGVPVHRGHRRALPGPG